METRAPKAFKVRQVLRVPKVTLATPVRKEHREFKGRKAYKVRPEQPVHKGFRE